MIGIDDDLHRIPDVVEIEILLRRRRGKPGARRISVLYPEHPPAADSQIGIMIEPEEGRDRWYPFPNIAPDHDPTVRRDVVRKQQVRVVEVVGEQRSPRY